MIRRQYPRTAVLLLSQYVEERYAADLLAANTSGVGYLLKQRVADVEEFAEAVRRVAAERHRARPAGRRAAAGAPATAIRSTG